MMLLIRQSNNLQQYVRVTRTNNVVTSRFRFSTAIESALDISSTDRRRRPIYVAATRQHVGKTSTSLALMSGLKKRFDKVGFIKPVGQQSVVVCEDGNEILVDKDAALVKQHYQLDHISYADTSPVLIPPGYTKDYIDGKITLDKQKQLFEQAYRRIEASSNVVLAEGTGHVAVGAIVDASNAMVASWMGAKMVLVANGGLGNSFDELELNRRYCQDYGVELAGVIINKVKPDKYQQTKSYLSKTFEQKWDGIPLLGCIPDRPFLGCPALADLQRLFPGASLVSGGEHRLRHYRIPDIHLVATSLNVFLRNLRTLPDRTLFVCHASRNDILLGYLMESHNRYRPKMETAMVVTGCQDFPISTQVLEIITSMPTAPPIVLINQPTHVVMERLYDYTPKLNQEDSHRVRIAVEHYEPYIDFDLLLERVGYDAAESA